MGPRYRTEAPADGRCPSPHLEDVRRPDRRFTLEIPELLAAFGELADAPDRADPDHPFVLAAGERRSFTANRAGVAPNELTSLHHRDPIAGTPWHKYVPARIEVLA
ncbi:hypothetical protein [Nocardia sp. CC227C]|uniref:hypothetical protein n=1 Tax=Nocardia sp. CC227C TaxID=3044562 RepID=UPI00278C6B74|nr:hypothetical protein [Nocardia sp. CC227C]